MKKRSSTASLGLAALLTLAGACRPGPAGVDAAGAPDAAPAPPALELGLELALPDGGILHRLLEPGGVTAIPVTRLLDLTANRPLRNYRLRILDELDRALASDDVPEEISSGLRYHVQLLAPLRPGHRYTVLLDAESGPALDDGQGRPLPEQRFELRTEGERERDTPAKRSHPPKHRGSR
ncbi:MAG TPA: hypothetical protein VEJ89_16020 [Myxococcaceae bacterium]|nr:hypothetical protein [Myxococcaceae bacterium]